MDSSSDEGKIFIGGIGWDTTEERLKDHFSRYGEVSHTMIMRDRITAHPRGFGFVVFSDPSVIPSVLQQTHTIDGRTVEAKRAMSREQQQTLKSGSTSSAGGNFWRV
ncbi:UNVERIFIED_CONTAM: Heterogeneous nuclear ribonucleoprotein 1 [Sesamum radiatum]|uniref:Heterogeneous nuclear ribonucleoprotein 1 n=1 Tax=Sesamum radiatum TaxID=300843 RepID=A0AAW2W7E4_SESRA